MIWEWWSRPELEVEKRESATATVDILPDLKGNCQHPGRIAIFWKRHHGGHRLTTKRFHQVISHRLVRRLSQSSKEVRQLARILVGGHRAGIDSVGDLMTRLQRPPQGLNGLDPGVARPGPCRMNICQTHRIRQQGLDVVRVWGVEPFRLSEYGGIVNGPRAERAGRWAHCEDRLDYQFLDVGLPRRYGHHYDRPVDGVQLVQRLRDRNAQQGVSVVQLVRVPQQLRQVRCRERAALSMIVPASRPSVA